jgi:ABC-type sulfate transport system permease component
MALVAVTMAVTTAVVVLLLYVIIFNPVAIVLVETTMPGQMMIEKCLNT